jgi:hypothetical protein
MSLAKTEEVTKWLSLAEQAARRATASAMSLDAQLNLIPAPQMEA